VRPGSGGAVARRREAVRRGREAALRGQGRSCSARRRRTASGGGDGAVVLRRVRAERTGAVRADEKKEIEDESLYENSDPLGAH
jgi:hypothetical protein